MGGLTLCVPTYRRPALLERLLRGVREQTRRPDHWIIVDGEGGSLAVRRTLETLAREAAAEPIRLIRSRRANLPFQRRLGWQASAGAERLLYLDDDLELPAKDAIEHLCRPLEEDPAIAAATAPIETPTARVGGAPPADGWRRLLGASRRVAPGGLTPTGVRRPPIDDDAPWSRVEWLRGGAMAFRRSALTLDSFPPDLLALAECGFGLGEDLILARRAMLQGPIAHVARARFRHPGSDVSRAYVSDSRRRAFAEAYSRRLVNDYYRSPARPRITDRLALLRTYAAVAAARFFAGESDAVLGYLHGAGRALWAPPRATRLTPEINWDAEAELSLQRQETFA